MTPLSPLRGFDQTIGALRIEEVTDRALVSVATPLDGDKPVAAAIKKAYKCAMPEPGKSVVSPTDNARLIWMAPGQIFVSFDGVEHWPERHVAGLLGDAGYYVNQTDAWVCLRVSGPAAIDALERICPVDLHPERFGVDAAERTGMEHMGALIIREAETSYLLMSASSSARSFLHAVETSAHNIT